MEHFSMHKVQLNLKYIGNDLNPFLFFAFFFGEIFHFPSRTMETQTILHAKNRKKGKTTKASLSVRHFQSVLSKQIARY